MERRKIIKRYIVLATTEEKKTFSDLKFVRVNSPGTELWIIDKMFRAIPRELFEQIKGIEFNIDLLYETPAAFVSGVSTMFYVLVDSEDKIKGVLWAFINVLTETIDVHVLSIDKEYQDGNALKDTLEFIRSWMSDGENLKIKIITKRPQVYRRNGWKDSKSIILET